MKNALPIIACMASLAQPLSAQTLEPDASDMTAAISAALPAWWRVESPEIVAKVNEGDAVTPLWRFRAEADAFLDTPLYAVDPAATALPGPFIVVTETLPAASARKVYVVGEAAYKAGAWNLDVTVENTFDDLGLPADTFDGPVLVPGTPEADAALARLDAGRALADRLQADTQSREAAFATAVASLDAVLDDAQAEQAARVEAALAGMQARLAEVRTVFDANVDAATADLETQVAAAEAQLTALADGGIEAARVAAETRAAEIEAQALEELAAARAKVADLRLAAAQSAAEQAAAIAAAEAEALRAAAEAKQTALAALRETLASDDPGIRRTAFAEALQSGEWVLQREALSMLVSEGPTLTLRFARADAYDGENLPESNAFIFTAFDSSTGNFEGERRWSNGSEGTRGTIGQGGLVIQDRWCQATLIIQETRLEGPMDCGRDKWYGIVALY